MSQRKRGPEREREDWQLPENAETQLALFEDVEDSSDV